MSNIVKKKQYDFVNLAKFISAVFVIGIHTSPLQGLHPKLNYFTDVYKRQGLDDWQ